MVLIPAQVRDGDKWSEEGLWMAVVCACVCVHGIDNRPAIAGDMITLRSWLGRGQGLCAAGDAELGGGRKAGCPHK